MTPFILPLDSPDAGLENTGGKGANLARLVCLGFPVPGGFILLTEGYRAFVAANQIEAVIQQALSQVDPQAPQTFEVAAQLIREAFGHGTIPMPLEEAVGQAYAALGAPPVAVRSSATAEDLPDLSFAGQQDTYLNICGEEALLSAVVDCWSSLWTARAIGYRARNAVPQDSVSLAVVIQVLVPSQAAGVLFTANPVSGLLSETVIDATLGLGEALVSGQVEPDHYVVDTLQGKIIEKTLGAKAVATRPRPEGGVTTAPEAAIDRQALPDEQILELAALGLRVAEAWGSPQDIEWAFAEGKLSLLQSRAITSLFPVPQVSYDPLVVWFSFGAVQGLVGPITPLGCDAIQNVIASAGGLFGLRLKPEEVSIFASAGERIWIKISDFIRHPIGCWMVGDLLSFLEPSVGRILRPLMTEPRLGAGTGKLKISSLVRILRFALPVLAKLFWNMLRPEKARAGFDARIDTYLSTAQIAPAEDRFNRLANIVAFIRSQVARVILFLLPEFVPVFGPSMGAFNLLNRIAGDNRELAQRVTRGLPRNVTTEMDLALWRTATEIRASAEAQKEFLVTPAQVLAGSYLHGTLPPAAQTALAGFLEQYGMRGVGEIDFGQPRWREDPTPVIYTLQSYLSIDPGKAPDAVFARGEQAAGAAIEELAGEVRRRPGGWIKERIVRAAARRIRLLMGARESPKFFIVRVMGIGRRALLEVGGEFVVAGALDCPDDLVFLRLSELEALSRNEPRDWKALVAGRRAVYERELRRQQVPRVLVSDGRAFYEGLGAETDNEAVITGSPVSPGVVEGIVHVVLDPRGTQLAPGEILVCPGTDPAWTPLFMAAGGLVMEVGGMMTHGSVVAREYGLPAIVGVHQATLRLRNGQRVRVDGTQGKIYLL